MQTCHISGTLEVTKVVANINQFVKRSAAALGGATGQQAPEPLSAKDIRQISEVVKNPSFDVYVGEDDDILRRVSGRLGIRRARGRLRTSLGLKGGSLEFSVEFSDANGDQSIEAPANARPLSALTRVARRGRSARRWTGSTGGVRGRTAAPRSRRPPRDRAAARRHRRPTRPTPTTSSATGLPLRGAARGHRRPPALRRAAASGAPALGAQAAAAAWRRSRSRRDAPTLGERRLCRRERPAVRSFLAVMVRRRALERHAAGVVAKRARSSTSRSDSNGSAGTPAKVRTLALDRLRPVDRSPGSASAPHRRPPRVRGPQAQARAWRAHDARRSGASGRGGARGLLDHSAGETSR